MCVLDVEVTGLRGFSRRSGGLMDWASLFLLSLDHGFGFLGRLAVECRFVLD